MWTLFASLGVAVTTVAHLGHTRETSPRLAAHNYHDQLRHKWTFVQDLLEGRLQVDRSSAPGDAGADLAAPALDPARRPRVVLCGHSIGAHICVWLLRRLSAGDVPLALLLTPTLLHIGRTPNGLRLTPVFRFFRLLVAALASIMFWLPRRLRHLLVRHELGTADHCLRGADCLFHFHAIRNALWMALHEMMEVTSLDADTLRAHGGRVRALFAPRDGWVPDWHLHAIRSAVRPANLPHFESGLDVPHAFVVGSSDAVAERCIRWIRSWARRAREPARVLRDSFVIGQRLPVSHHSGPGSIVTLAVSRHRLAFSLPQCASSAMAEAVAPQLRPTGLLSGELMRVPLPHLRD